LVSASGPVEHVTAFSGDPADSRNLYVAVGGKGAYLLYASTDGGKSWRRSALLLPRRGKCIWIHVSAVQPNPYVVEKNSVAIREAGRWKQFEPPTGVAEFRDVSGGFGSGGKLTLYGVCAKKSGEGLAGGILVSHDGGATWAQANEAFLRSAGLGPADAASSFPELTSVAASFNHPEVAYVSYEDWHVSPHALIHGVARTADGGRTWTLVWKESESSASNVHDAWLSERFGPGWGEPGISLGVSPANPDICYRTDDGRTMRTYRRWYQLGGSLFQNEAGSHLDLNRTRRDHQLRRLL